MEKKLKGSVRGFVGSFYYLVLLGLLGCGYQFSGRSESFPKDVRTVYVETFLNRTREVGIEHEMTSALRGELYRMGQLQVVDQMDQADAILSGLVRSFDSRVTSVNRRDEVLQYESTMSVDLTFRRREPNEILWRGQGIQLTKLYSGSRAAVVTTSSDFRTGTLNADDVRRMTDIQLTETENRQTRQDLIEGFARELHQRLMQLF
jgi:outer membrane lipopolysaccharide assembly protein LptE/RlpB